MVLKFASNLSNMKRYVDNSPVDSGNNDFVQGEDVTLALIEGTKNKNPKVATCSVLGL